MANISTWSTTAASNNSNPPDGAPENMAPSAVNDTIRETMASVRTWYEDAEWTDFGYTHTYVAATQFKISGTDYTTEYHVGRRVRVVAATPGTIYGTITATSFSTDTTVTVSFDSGSLSNESLTVSLAALSSNSASSVPGVELSGDDYTFQGNVTVEGSVIQAKGSDVSSASSLSLGAGNSFDVTGTTTITSIATVGVGTVVTLQFDGALTLTHHATDLILPGAANITTAAGDIAVFYEYASGDWRCISYTAATGRALVAEEWEFVSASGTLSGGENDVEFTDLAADYDYKLVGRNLTPTTDATALRLQTSDDAGGSPTYDTGASDYRSVSEIDVESGTDETVLGGQPVVTIASSVGSSTNEMLFEFEAILFHVGASTFTSIRTTAGFIGSDSNLRFQRGTHVQASADVVQAVRVFFGTHATNTFAAGGWIELWRRAHRTGD